MKKICLVFALCALLIGMVPTDVFAQGNNHYGKKPNKRHHRRKSVRVIENQKVELVKNESLFPNKTLAVTRLETDNSNSPLNTVVATVSDTNYTPVREDEDLQSGNVVVKITSNGNASVKLGMSAMGVTMVEFPADDPIYEIHRNDLYSDFVTVSCRRQDESGRCLDNPTDALIIRPGKNFRFTGNNSDSTVITVQRVSGIVVSFVIVPVASISQNANHVVVTYPVDQVIEARIKSGLAVNLAPFTPSQPKLSDKFVASVNQQDGSTPVVNASFTNNSENAPVVEPLKDELETSTVEQLRRIGNSGISLKFGKPVHGISVAVAPNNARLSGRVIDVFAVRNTLSVPIRLVPDMPELYVETLAKKSEASVNSMRVPILYVATTASDDNILQPGETYFFSIAYEAPILGAKQMLRVGFSQTNAADEPVALELSGIAR